MVIRAYNITTKQRIDRSTIRDAARHTWIGILYFLSYERQYCVACSNRIISHKQRSGRKCSHRVRALANTRCCHYYCHRRRRRCRFFSQINFALMMAFICGGMRSLVRTAGCAHESSALSNKLARLSDARLRSPQNGRMRLNKPIIIFINECSPKALTSHSKWSVFIILHILARVRSRTISAATSTSVTYV